MIKGEVQITDKARERVKGEKKDEVQMGDKARKRMGD